MPAKYTAFSIDEFRARFARARDLLRGEGFGACLMMAPEHLYYFGGYDSWVGVNSPQALIFTGGGDAPVLLLRDVDLSLALETTWVEDVRTYSLVLEDFPSRVAEILAEKGVANGTLAIETQSYALPHGLGVALAEALTPAELVDATSKLGMLRLLKSPAEMAVLERAAGFAELGLRALQSALREGISEIALAAEVEAAMRRAGSDYPAIPTELCSGNRSAGGHATPREKTIVPGDLVHAEFAGVHQRYHATAIQTLSLGAPSLRAAELYDLALRSLKAGIAAVRPGVPVADVEEASLEPLKAAGLEHAAQMRFGYGIGIAYPPIWLEPLQIARGFEERLEPGMVFVLHSCLELPDEHLGVIQGGTYALEETGLRMLAGAGGADLLVL